ncbi:hypothetical protein CLV84_2714 [Neolewinella xylanilytica]|uniref:Uncharacterized protein n=1 Tax=Neolewinella xylanilytica TaxID=1514080 RepID=A0A2S6I3Q6_9BACT|nr:hypothetical protein [Neolewinella xylanilytica]PPK85807.1 hypothetical protein CLV84_2714 [Neolewinella xylanilytica]
MYFPTLPLLQANQCGELWWLPYVGDIAFWLVYLSGIAILYGIYRLLYWLLASLYTWIRQ